MIMIAILYNLIIKKKLIDDFNIISFNYHKITDI